MLAYVRRDNQAMLHIFENYDFVRQPSDSLEEVVLCRTLESTDQNPELIGLFHTSKVLGSMDLSSSREVSSSRLELPGNLKLPRQTFMHARQL